MISPYLSRYRNAEYLQYMKDIIRIVNQVDVDTLLLTDSRDGLLTSVNAFEKLFKQTQGMPLLRILLL